MPNKIDADALKAALSAFQTSRYDSDGAAMQNAIEAYERAKWRPGAPTEDGLYLCAVTGRGIQDVYCRDGDLTNDEAEVVAPGHVTYHQPFPEPPKEGE